ncbi:MAG: hypothetical protein ABR886_01110 [Dehalococcoidales bacterium]|jgi:hypothetical protein
MIDYIVQNWQFIITLVLGMAALVVAFLALRSSRNLEIAVGGDEPGIIVGWYKTNEQTICNLSTVGEVQKAYLKLGKKRERLSGLEENRSQSLTLPLVERGTRWKLSYVDPATGKTLRYTGLVRY